MEGCECFVLFSSSYKSTLFACNVMCGDGRNRGTPHAFSMLDYDSLSFVFACIRMLCPAPLRFDYAISLAKYKTQMLT